MSQPPESVTLSAEQVADLQQKLADMRHNVNNNLALMVAAVELIKRKPEMAARFADNLIEQPQRIVDEIKKFSVVMDSQLRPK